MNSTLPSRTFIVIAAFNEVGAIGEVLRELTATGAAIVVVDDGSRDETAAMAACHTPHVLRHLLNRGQGAAIQTGIDHALRCGAEYIVTFDADGQHQVSDIPAMLAPIVNGECEITLGSRFLGSTTNLPASRRFTLIMAVLFTRIVNGVKLTDAHNGFRAFSRAAAQRIAITSDRMAHASELIDLIKRSGLRFREAPVHVVYSEYSLHKGQTSGSAFRIAMHYLLGRVFD